MIFGDPYKFAVLVEHIPEWSGRGFKNGLFHYFIDGELFPDKVATATLNVEVVFLGENNSLVAFPENREIFEATKEHAFNVMLGMISPELVDPDAQVPDEFEPSYIYLAATPNSSDAGFYSFCVAHGNIVRVVGAKISSKKRDNLGNLIWVDENPMHVQEAFLSKGEMREIIEKAIKYCQ